MLMKSLSVLRKVDFNALMTIWSIAFSEAAWLKILSGATSSITYHRFVPSDRDFKN